MRRSGNLCDFSSGCFSCIYMVELISLQGCHKPLMKLPHYINRQGGVFGLIFQNRCMGECEEFAIITRGGERNESY